MLSMLFKILVSMLEKNDICWIGKFLIRRFLNTWEVLSKSFFEKRYTLWGENHTEEYLVNKFKVGNNS